jgi:hypothetical protein
MAISIAGAAIRSRKRAKMIDMIFWKRRAYVEAGSNQSAPLNYKGHPIKAFAHWTGGDGHAPVMQSISVVIGMRSRILHGPWHSKVAAMEAVLEAASQMVDA